LPASQIEYAPFVAHRLCLTVRRCPTPRVPGSRA